jgi:hypothetical protein
VICRECLVCWTGGFGEFPSQSKIKICLNNYEIRIYPFIRVSCTFTFSAYPLVDLFVKEWN